MINTTTTWKLTYLALIFTILAFIPMRSQISASTASVTPFPFHMPIENELNDAPPIVPQPGMLFFIDRPTGLFEYRGDALPVSPIRSQNVRVLDVDGDWMSVNTAQGPMWIHLNFVPPVQTLDNFMRQYPGISVFYKNLETGIIYERNADRLFFGASISKASYALYLHQRAERGEIDLNQTLTLKRQDWNDGSGIINTTYYIGQEFTICRLIELNLYQSDNIATNMLRRTFGIDGYRDFVRSIGADANRVRNNVFNSNLTAREAGIFAIEIWEYVNSNGYHAAKFGNALRSNQFPFIVADYPILSKTGWTSNIAWHDMAIVEAPSPYILILFSTRPGFTDECFRIFEDISLEFQRFNDMWF